MPLQAALGQENRLENQKTGLQVLILEDSHTDALLILHELKRYWSIEECEIVQTRDKFIHALEFDWDIILSDYNLPGYNGLEAFADLQNSTQDIPFILVSGELNEKLILEALQSGVRDYLRKDDIARLFPLVERVLYEKKLKNSEKKIRRRQEFLIDLLELLNRDKNTVNLYQQLVEKIRTFGNFSAVSLRLKEFDHFPVKALSGFSPDLCQLEKSRKDGVSHSQDDNQASSFLENCLCGKILLNKHTPQSYWFNNQQELQNQIAVSITETCEQYRCLKEGYHSVAVLPIHDSSSVSGLLHLSSKNKNIFDDELVKFYEKVSHIIGIAHSRSTIEHNLQEQGNLVDKLIKHSSNIYFTRTSEREFSFVSPQVENILGYTPEEIIKDWRRTISDNPMNIISLQMAKNTLDTGKTYPPYRLELLDKQKNKVLVEVREAPVIENGKLVQVVGSLTDLSKIQKSQRALLKRDIQYHKLVNKAKVAICEYDSQGRITYLNNTFSQLLGFQKKALKNEEIINLIHPDDKDKFILYQKKHFQGLGENDRYDIRGIAKNGSSIYLEITVEFIFSVNQICGIRLYCWNITQRKQDELLLQTVYNIAKSTHFSPNTMELFQQIRLLLSEVMDVTNIYIALYNDETDKLWIPLSEDSQDEIIYFPAGKTLSKYVIQSGAAMLLHKEDMDELTQKGIIDQVGKDSLVWLGVPLKNGNKIFGLIVVQSYDNAELYTTREKEILEYVSEEIASAIQRKQMDDELKSTYADLKKMHDKLQIEVKKKVKLLREKDAELEASSRQAIVGEMISRLAHNWRQPLNVISLLAQSIKDAWDFDELTDELMQDKISTCINEIKNLSSQIDELRYFYKSNETRQHFDAVEAARETVLHNRNRFQNNNISLNLDSIETCPVDGYRSKFMQVINNILANAFDILLDRKIASPQVIVKLWKEADYLYVSISDNGGGVEKNLEADIFDLYTSTKEELNNTGLGLYLSRQIIVNHMKGDIWLKNHPKGAEFLIKISHL